MFRIFFPFLVLLAVTGDCFARDAEVPVIEELWMALMLDDGHAGHVHRTRSVHQGAVETREAFVLQASRNGVPLSLEIIETNLETVDGRPLAFSVTQRISGAEMRLEGQIENGRATVTSHGAGAQQVQSFAWPEDALLREGARLYRLTQGFEPGTRYAMKLFLPSDLKFVENNTAVAGTERVDLLGTEQTLTRLVDTMMLGNTSTEMVSWVDPAGNEKRVRISVMGSVFEGIACPRACATAEVTPQEIFEQALVRSPRSLSHAEREQPVTYRIRPRSTDGQLHFEQSDEQQSTRDGDDFLVTVRRLRPEPGAAATGADGYLAATRWLQVDAPEIQSLTQKARGDAESANLIMLQLQEFVRHYVDDKNLSVGYASALEVARNRSGDCTEHALLLAALGRAAGIPTRIATGLAYVDRWLGAGQVFVPHAWTQAYIGGQWISYDAALGRFGTGHIALAHGDGEPGGFYDGVNTLGQIEIIAATSGG